MAAVAASLELDEKNIIRNARICVGAVAPVPKLAKNAGAVLVGKAADAAAFREAAEEAQEISQPISDIRSSADYRRELIGIVVLAVLAALGVGAHELGAAPA